MRRLLPLVALVAAAQAAGALANPSASFVCPRCDLSDRDGLIFVGGGGMGGGGGMNFEGGGMGATGGGMGGGGMPFQGGGMGGTGGGMGGGSGGGLGDLFGFHPEGCPEPRPKRASRHPEARHSSCAR
jgi:hypothetical protein